MQFLWPFKADYRVMHLDEDYTQTVIGRNQRDYLWIMARTPGIPEQDMQQLLQLVADQGYDPAKVLPVTQQWPAVRETGDTP
jgi:apolipoprotein D and lipocalin family protein